MFLPDDWNLGHTVIDENTDRSSNTIPESMYSVLSSLYIGDTKYGIHLRKTYGSTNITIHKMTERIESTKIL